MKLYFATAATLVSALALASCGGGTTTTPPKNTTTASNTTSPAPAPTPAGDTGSAPAPTGDSTNQNFSLVNNSGHTIMTLNVSPNNEGEWGEDILGRDVLATGESADITFPREASQCSWDIKVTYDDGESTDLRAQNLCELSTVTINP